MGLPLGPTLANVFLVHFEKNWLQNCPSDFKPHYYRRYVDGRHANMPFTVQCEKQSRVSFLDVQIIREGNIFTTSVYRKPTFSGVYIHFDSFLPSTYKFGTVYTLAYR